jgi:hypothetical protein
MSQQLQALFVGRHFKMTPFSNSKRHNLKTQLNIFQWALTVLIVIACGLIFIGYGWTSFATFTERPGLNGDLYYYYRTDRIVFGLYQLLIATGALLTIIRLCYFIYRDDKPKVTKTFIHFAVFLAVLILCEIYLNTRFVGKG